MNLNRKGEVHYFRFDRYFLSVSEPSASQAEGADWVTVTRCCVIGMDEPPRALSLVCEKPGSSRRQLAGEMGTTLKELARTGSEGGGGGARLVDRRERGRQRRNDPFYVSMGPRDTRQSSRN